MVFPCLKCEPHGWDGAVLTQSCNPQLAPHAAAKAVRSGANPFSPLALHHLPRTRGMQPSLLLLLPGLLGSSPIKVLVLSK